MFRKMPVIHNHKQILDKAFKRARTSASIVRIRDRIIEKRIKELRRIEVASDQIMSYLSNIIEKTPRFDKLSKFYQNLISIIVDVDYMKKSLGAVNWANKKIEELLLKYKKKLRGAQIKDLQRIRREYYGRLSSILKQINKNLLFLEECRRRLLNLPKFKDMKTIVIAGAPNVGKSSVLKAITNANPGIQPYPFTTKSILVGYLDEEIQVIDTPGLLDRKIEDRNKIELQAILALKYLAHKILYVFDLSETCGYTKEQQLKLYKDIKKNFKIPIIVCINKVDIKKEELNLKEEVFKVSCTKNIEIDKLKKHILSGVFPSKDKFK